MVSPLPVLTTILTPAISVGEVEKSLDSFLLMEDLNCEMYAINLKDFVDTYNLTYLVKDPVCH